MNDAKPYVIVHKMPHGLWRQEDLRPDFEAARQRMASLKAEDPRDTCAWDVWTWDEWERMQRQRLTMDAFEEHVTASTPPPSVSEPDLSTEFARALELLPDDRVMAAVGAAVNNLRDVASWYGTIPDQVYTHVVTAQLFGAAHLLSEYDEERFLTIARAVHRRYHTAASNTRRQREVAEAKANEG